MISLLEELLRTTGETIRDVLPIAAILVFFQLFVLRKKLPDPRRIVSGFLMVLAGLVLFLIGLEQTVFPVGKTMAAQFSAPSFLGIEAGQSADPAAFAWIYLFAFAIGFSTTIAEPALIAVAQKAENLTAGAIGSWGLRLAVATGVAIGISLGTLRIVLGTPLHYFIGVGYVVVIVQTLFAPRMIVPLAYDSGGVTTSTVTVPLVAALGLGLAESLPGRSPLIDGFGLIAFASLFPMMTVMAYAQISEWLARRDRAERAGAETDLIGSQEDGS